MPTRFSGPTVITAGPDGAAWTMQMFANQIARIDPVTGHVREYPVPWGPTSPRPHTSAGPRILPAGFTPLSCTIKPGADGNIYFTNGIRNQIGQLNPDTGAVRLFTPRGRFGGLFPLTDLSSSADAIWFSQTTANRIGRFDLATHQFRDYAVPTRASMPVGVFSSSDGSVWFAETAANKIGHLDPSTGHITEHRLPQSLSGPFVINGETEGRYVWFTQMSGNRIGRLDLHTNTIDSYRVPLRASFPTEVCAAPDGNIYFTHLIRNGIGRLDPRDGTVTNIAIPAQRIRVQAADQGPAHLDRRHLQRTRKRHLVHLGLRQQSRPPRPELSRHLTTNTKGFTSCAPGSTTETPTFGSKNCPNLNPGQAKWPCASPTTDCAEAICTNTSTARCSFRYSSPTPRPATTAQ